MGGIQPQFGALFGPTKKHLVPERICSPGIRLCSGSLRFASFARLKADARRCLTSESFGFKSERLCGGARRNFAPFALNPDSRAAVA
jgi:hypothetical protein